MAAKRTGRPATGWAKFRNGANGLRWYTQITLKSGKRSPWIPLPKEIPADDLAAAKMAAKLVSDDARAGGLMGAGTRETVEEFAKRWLEAREGRISSVRDNRGHLTLHILPIIGPLEMRAVTREDIERVVSALDVKVRRGALGAKTAKNAWGTLSKLFDDATNAKPAEGLRCLEADPTTGVRGPDDNDAGKLLQFLYPSELATFLACERVPLRWQRNVVIAIYLCLRDGEQRALKWSAVDLEHGMVTIQETYDRRKGGDREGTKSGAARTVPIRAELLPMLEAMHAEAKAAANGAEPEGYVCKLPSLRDMARGLRRWLKKAGVDRAQLHVGTSVSKQLRWHDLRASGATWLAVEGKAATEIRDTLGHTQTSMTDRYVRSAAMLRGGRFGRPFPTLPERLTAPRGFRCTFAPRSEIPTETLLKTSGADGARKPDDCELPESVEGSRHPIPSPAPTVEGQLRESTSDGQMMGRTNVIDLAARRLRAGGR